MWQVWAALGITIAITAAKALRAAARRAKMQKRIRRVGKYMDTAEFRQLIHGEEDKWNS